MKIQLADQTIRIRLNQAELSKLEQTHAVSYQLLLQKTASFTCTIQLKPDIGQTLHTCHMEYGNLNINLHPSMIDEIRENPKDGLVFQFEEIMVSLALDLKRD